MVAVLPPRQLWTGSLGEGLSRGIEQGMHRSMLQNALSKAESQLNNPQAKPTQQLFGLMKGLAGYPGAERFIAPVFEQLQRQRILDAEMKVQSPGYAQNKNIPFQSRGEQPQSRGEQPQSRGEQPQSSDEQRRQMIDPGTDEFSNNINSAAQKLISFDIQPPKQMTGAGTLSATELGKGIIPNTFTPEQRFQERQKAIQAGIDPSIVDHAMDSWDKAAIQQKSLEEDAALKHAIIAEARSKRQTEFRENAMQWFGGEQKILPDDFQLFMQISEQPQFENLGSDTARFRAAKKVFDVVQRQKHALQQLGTRPKFFAESAERHKKAVENSVKPLIKLGQRDLAAKLIQTELGYGPVTASKSVNDLPIKTYKDIKNLPNYYSPRVEISPWEDSPQIEQSDDTSHKKWIDFFKSSIQPGNYTTSNPNQYKLGTSLYVLQDEAAKKDMPERAFFNIINSLEKNGDIKLDDYQRIELTELSKPSYKRYGLPELLFRWLPSYKEKK
jgi:hypothetical protein